MRTYSIMLRLLTFILILPALVASTARADWIYGSFSERAGIDSLNRFLVFRDVEAEHLYGWPILPLGDISGDSSADLLLCRNNNNPLTVNRAFLYYGGYPADGDADAEFFGFKPQMGVVGDVNDDGFADLGLYHGLPQRFDLFFGGSLLDDTADFTIPNIFPSIIHAADLDGDGVLELALGSSVNGGFVNIYRMDSLRDTIPEYIIPDTSKSFGRNAAVGDFNGDGQSDLAVAAFLNRDTNFVKFYWGGPAFDTIADFIIKSTSPQFGRSLISLGDFDGDGYGDLLISGGANDPYGIYLGGPSIDDVLDVIVNVSRCYGGYFPPAGASLAGDINNDGFPDLVLGYDAVGCDEVYVFLGGNVTDTVIGADIYFNDYMVDGPVDCLGTFVSGIGDFNGDGIDDFAASSRTASGGINWYGEVNLFAGYDSKATGVGDEPDPQLPFDFHLAQNYPNPFNPTTTIRFDLPKRGRVTLTVYNVLGRIIETLCDRGFPAGSHSVEWDAKGYASGVYLYRIEASGVAETRKMLLLK